MKNPKIAKVLREYRTLNQISVNEVSNILKENNNYAAPKTIYGWENGTTQPDADTLMFLCDLYNIEDILEAFGYKSREEATDFLLLPKEKELIQAYRSKKEMQPAIDRLLDLDKDK